MRFIELNIDAKEYKLRFGTYGLEKLEKELGVSMLEDNGGLTQMTTSFSALTKAFYWGLKRQHKEINRDNIHDLLDNALEEYGFEKLLEMIIKAINFHLKVENLEEQLIQAREEAKNN